MRDVCHCTAPIAALNISTFGKVGWVRNQPPSLDVAASRVGFSRRIMKGCVTRWHAWLWTLAFGMKTARRTHGHAATREAAMAASPLLIGC
jgi:hypothetical protein